MSNFQFIGRIISDGESIKINGINPWRHDWEQTKEPQIRVTHPQYPQQIYWFNVFKIIDLDKDLVFVAGEYSNGAWGFYVPPFYVVEFV
jgi:hypothetical protein